jgi:hypothetical protein
VYQCARASCRWDGDGVGIDLVMEDCRLGRLAANGVRVLCGKLMVTSIVMLDYGDEDGWLTSCR